MVRTQLANNAGGGGVMARKLKRLHHSKFQGTAASFAIQRGVSSITLEPLLPSLCAAFSQALSVNSFRGRIRDERAGDALAISLGPRDPKRIGRAEKTRQEPVHNSQLGDRRKWPL